VIRLLLDPTRFECETADEAAALAGLFGIRVNDTAPSVDVAPPPVNDQHRPVNKLSAGQILSAAGARPRGAMAPTGHEKTCKKCGASFPVLDRTDCPSVYCRACRPKPPKRGARAAAAKTKSAASRGSSASVPATAKAPIRGCAKAGCLELFEATHPGMVHCEKHRLGMGQNREQAGRPVILRPVPAAGQMGTEPVDLPVGSCTACGASVPTFELIDEKCRECTPVGTLRRTA
jgi:hypothetical protein